MLRTILGVIAGFFVTIVLIFVLFTAIYFAMGPERAFEPGSYTVSGLWTAVAFGVFAVAGLAGGAVCSKIAPTPTASRVLAGIVLALWLSMVAMTFSAPPQSRTGDADNFEAMSRAYTPAPVAIINAVVGAAGVLMGGFIARRKR